jgi:SAM-dependent methyltransferase
MVGYRRWQARPPYPVPSPDEALYSLSTGIDVDKATVSYYDENAAEVSRRFESADMSRNHRCLLRHLSPRGARVLEIGCGSGRDAAFLLANGYDIRGVDASAGLIEEALKIHPELQGRLSVGSVPFPQDGALLRGTFQAVVCLAVLMHVPEADLAETVSQIDRMLEAGGTVFLSVSTERPGVDGHGRGTGGRLFLERRPEELQGIFERQGFRLAARYDTPDVHARAIAWHSLVFTPEKRA